MANQHLLQGAILSAVFLDISQCVEVLRKQPLKSKVPVTEKDSQGAGRTDVPS